MEFLKKNVYSYKKALTILTSQGKFHISLGLERIGRVLELLDNPHETLKVIHVAGTNGKGSTCAMLSSVLTEAGYKTGFYSSPHLVEYIERIKINDIEISEEDFARLVFKVIETADKAEVHVTEFEILTAAAFLHFKENEVDFAVLETGLGGRLDATNVVKKPILTILTSIDFDHTDRLGDTIEQIAFEKAGIIKNNVPVITLKDNNGLEIIKNISSDKSSELILADSSDINNYEISLSGLWQLKNLSLVLESVKYLNKTGLTISDQALRCGLKNTNWPARFQYIEDKKLILDGAHNLSGAILLKESLDFYFPAQKRIWIYSSLNTKDYKSIINTLFRPGDIVICTKSISKNAVRTCELSQKIADIYPDVQIYQAPDVIQAYNMSASIASNGTLTIIAGSLYTIGELLANFSK
ncbi:MAG: bifunctional folylpolyglutamate synthase/dihydrofolate synthase [Candidatus Gastranaerophilales bacterium]|nr:bifunctional folylpolyglutamate synthase/dihydrofolate synthase [Candidatus Gastranaerophilales bacterium]